MRVLGVSQVGRCSEQHAIDYPEHRGVRADPEGQCQYDTRGESWLGAKAAHGVSRVLKDRLEEHRASRVARLLLRSIDAAECDPGAAQCFVRRQPGTHELVRFALDMEAKLVVELLFDAIASHDRAEAIAKVTP
jgi:hypothetical protein